MSPGSSSTGSRLIVASAAPVTMFVAPGPIDDVQARSTGGSLARVGGRGCDHALLVARQPVEGQLVRRSASSSAWPTPATLPWPKMPKQPAISRCSTPSRSVYWTPGSGPAPAPPSVSCPRQHRVADRPPRPTSRIQRAGSAVKRHPHLGAGHPRRGSTGEPGAANDGPCYAMSSPCLDDRDLGDVSVGVVPRAERAGSRSAVATSEEVDLLEGHASPGAVGKRGYGRCRASSSEPCRRRRPRDRGACASVAPLRRWPRSPPRHRR